MKKITLLAASVAVLFTLGMTSCSKEDSPTLPLFVSEPVALSFSGSALDTYISTKANDPLAFKTTLGIHILTINATDIDNPDDPAQPTDHTLASNPEARYNNIKFIADASGIITKDPAGDLNVTKGYDYKVYAYSPYQETATGEIVNTIPVMHNIDVMWADIETIPTVDATVATALVFNHKASQIVFTIDASKLAADKFLTDNITINVNGFYATGTMDLTDGFVKVASATDASADINESALDASTSGVTAAKNATTPIFFLPTATAATTYGNMTLDVTLTITEAGKESVEFTGEYTKVFNGGTSYTIAIAIHDRSVPLTFTATSKPWKTETGDINVGN